MTASLSEDSFSPPEPLEIQLYGSWSMSFPTWLVIQLGTYILLLSLLVGSYEVLFPSTDLGEHIYHILEKEPYVLGVLAKAPMGLLVIGLVEFCETIVGLILFRNKWVDRNHSQDS